MSKNDLKKQTMSKNDLKKQTMSKNDLKKQTISKDIKKTTKNANVYITGVLCSFLISFFNIEYNVCFFI
jgi:hypothetical protein